MCTSLALPGGDGRHLFGRTLDLEAHFGERVVVTPRRYPFSFADCYPMTRHYALLGMAAVGEGQAGGYPLYAEAMNERGLCMAGLRFARGAVYAPHPRSGRLNLAPWELIPFLLSTCATVAEARVALGDIHVVDQPFSDTVGTAPLHWHLADADPSHGGLILEVTAEGMGLYSDEAGVLTNDPAYPHQLAALRACTARRGDTPGLFGDYSSPSRFIRAALLRGWAVERAGITAKENGEGGETIARFFSILGAVSPTAGAVMTPEGECHRTLYTCCMDTARGAYLYRTEADPDLHKVSFRAQDLGREALLLPSVG